MGTWTSALLWDLSAWSKSLGFQKSTVVVCEQICWIFTFCRMFSSCRAMPRLSLAFSRTAAISPAFVNTQKQTAGTEGISQGDLHSVMSRDNAPSGQVAQMICEAHCDETPLKFYPIGRRSTNCRHLNSINRLNEKKTWTLSSSSVPHTAGRTYGLSFLIVYWFGEKKMAA